MNNDNIITDKINELLSKSQEFLRPFVSASLFLQRFDYFILLLIILLFVACLFTSTNVMGGIALLIIVLTILKMLFIRGQNVEFTLPNLILFGFLIICYISVLFSPYVALSYKGFFKTFVYIAFYFSMVQFFRFNKNKIVPLIFIMCFMVTAESLYAILQSFQPLEAIATWQDVSYVNEEHLLSRVYGTLKPYNPNLLCGYLLVGLASINTVAFWAFLGKHKKTFTFSIASLIITLTAIFLTGSRGGYLGAFAVFIIAVILINILAEEYLSQNAHEAWKKVCACFFGLATVAIVFSPSILRRFLSIFMLRGDSSTSFRMNVYQSTWKMFFDNWFSGVGVGNETFRNMYGLYMKTGFDALSAYSIYLEILVESGIFAFLFIVSFFVMIIKSAIKFINGNYRIEQKAIIISIIIMLAGVFTHGLFDTVFFRPQLQFMFWTNIAIMTVILDDAKDYEINNVEQIIMKLSDFVTGKIKKITKGV